GFQRTSPPFRARQTGHGVVIVASGCLFIRAVRMIRSCLPLLATECCAGFSYYLLASGITKVDGSPSGSPEMCRVLMFAAGLLVAAGARSASGQDKVVLRHGNLGGKMTLSGTVEDYTGEQITIRDDSSKTRRVYPGSEVVEIETTRSLPHTRGLELL